MIEPQKKALFPKEKGQGLRYDHGFVTVFSPSSRSKTVW